ncbi:hypothetical protein [Kocuria sp.]|uniref:hypothetical protein n=1 Tax=Kocuria sp. TaxID=1871328 RepID=UPI0026E0D19D|nr:hypothetical protein [Kocuria sp.]MDO5618403.1 hypothetical protein [Kocuria sp.]
MTRFGHQQAESGDESDRHGHRWVPQPHLTWLRDGSGPVYLAIFNDLRPRVLAEPTASIWEILAQSGTDQNPGVTVGQILSELEKAGLLPTDQLADPKVQADVEGVLTQLQDMDAVRRLDE